MFFITDDESQAYISAKGYKVVVERSELVRPTTSVKALKIDLEQQTLDVYQAAKVVASWFTMHSWALLWITEHGIWPSSENPHLYYRLRQSYGETRQLKLAPGHLFLGHEGCDLSVRPDTL